MTEPELRAVVLCTLGLTDAPKEDQDVLLAEVESIANERFALALPEMLSDEQLKTIDNMHTEGKDDHTIGGWIEEQLPDYQGMMEDIIWDVAEEVAAAVM